MNGALNKSGPAAVLITLGIVFGDIGTSPLYVFTAITGGRNFDEFLILGSVSCVFWTLLLLATGKYVWLALQADNHGEGGIFALYALLKKTRNKWILIPALIGCATLISDGFITPAISISSAVEGLAGIRDGLPILPIVCGIVVALFAIQPFGTGRIGILFGPVMLTWFLVIGFLGVQQILEEPRVLWALNPLYGIRFMLEYPSALLVLGAVFLCTTGAEAMYADLGHCGKGNIRIAWLFVLSMLLLSYFGQAAFLIGVPEGYTTHSVFYAIVPREWLPWTILLATTAAIIASQALISGIFTLVSEAIKLKLWTNLKVRYPSRHKGQVYVPFINGFLMAGCLAVILLFRRAANMEAAYGLAITIDMLMTTLLLGYLMFFRSKTLKWAVLSVFALFALLEGTFLVSNAHKILHGGWFTLALASLIFVLLLSYQYARRLRNRVADYVRTDSILPLLDEVSRDESIPFAATHLVYPARAAQRHLIDATIVHSLFHMNPKRARVYWFVHLKITDEPYGVHYSVHPLLPNRCFYITLNIGFKEPHLLNRFMQIIFEQLRRAGEVNTESAYPSLSSHAVPPDFKYVLINSRVATDNHLSVLEILSIRVYRFLKSIGLSAIEDFGLDSSHVVEELIPINVAPIEKIEVTRVR